MIRCTVFLFNLRFKMTKVAFTVSSQNIIRYHKIFHQISRFIYGYILTVFWECCTSGFHCNTDLSLCFAPVTGWIYYNLQTNMKWQTGSLIKRQNLGKLGNVTKWLTWGQIQTDAHKRYRTEFGADKLCSIRDTRVDEADRQTGTDTTAVTLANGLMWGERKW